MRQPEHDHVTLGEQTWVDVPLGPGQENTNRGTLQFTRDGDPYKGTDRRRKPGDETAETLIRPVNGAV